MARGHDDFLHGVAARRGGGLDGQGGGLNDGCRLAEGGCGEGGSGEAREEQGPELQAAVHERETCFFGPRPDGHGQGALKYPLSQWG